WRRISRLNSKPTACIGIRETSKTASQEEGHVRPLLLAGIKRQELRRDRLPRLPPHAWQHWQPPPSHPPPGALSPAPLCPATRSTWSKAAKACSKMRRESRRDALEPLQLLHGSLLPLQRRLERPVLGKGCQPLDHRIQPRCLRAFQRALAD